MSRLSVLQRAVAADVHHEPFPYLVIENALPNDLYDELAASFPSLATLRIRNGASNFRWDYSTWQVRANPAVPKIWMDFIVYQTSPAFMHEVAALFGEAIARLYPDRFFCADSVRALRSGVREIDDFATRDILIDAQISGNTPVATASSVRTTHADKGDKLFSGLFYMRPDGYDAVGGDLTISRFKPEYRTVDDKGRLFGGQRGALVDDAHVEHVRTVPYARNTLVLFVNSLDSLHGVTVRQPSSQTRLFVNLIGEIDPPLYELAKDDMPARYLTPSEASLASVRTSTFKRTFRTAKRRMFG